MDIIVIDILLALIRCVDVGFRILNEVAPFDAANVREFAPPDGGAGIANTSVPRFSVEHILPNNTECIICVVHETAFGAALFVCQKIGIGAACVRENNSQHGIGVAGVGVTILVRFTFLQMAAHF